MPIADRRHFAIAFALTLAACATPPSPGEPGPHRVPLEPYLGTLRTVEVEVGGARHAFLFDTAGGATLLTPRLAAEVGCKPFGRVTGFRHSGERLDLPRCGAATFDLGGYEARVESAVFDLMALLPEGVPELGGIIAIQTFEGRPWTLDLSRNELFIENEASLALRTVAMKEIGVRSSRQGGGGSIDLFMRVDATPGALWLEVDSGNAGPVILSPHALPALGIDATPKPDETIDVVLPIAGFGAVNVKAVVKDTIYDGLLNAAFLDQHVLAVSADLQRAGLAPAGKR